MADTTAAAPEAAPTTGAAIESTITQAPQEAEAAKSAELVKADPKQDGLPDDPSQLKAIIHRLRSENAKDRTDAKAKAAETAQADLIDKIGRSLGIITDGDAPPSPEALTESLTQAQDEARLAQAQLAVYRAAQGKADADALLDSQAFNKAIAEVDLTDAKAISKAIDQFIADNPRFKPVQVTGSSAVDHPAGSGEGAITPDQFRRMNGQQRNELHATNPTLYRQLAEQA